MSGRPHNLSTRERFEEKYVVVPSGCWEWSATLTPAGYGQLRVSGRMVAAHRIAWKIHHGPIKDGMHVLHRCDNRRCVNPAHLFLGTHADNMADMNRKGRGPTREHHGRAKLTSDRVKEIRSLKGKMYQREIAAMFGISDSQVGNIHRNEHWVTQPDPELADYNRRYRDKPQSEAA